MILKIIAPILFIIGFLFAFSAFIHGKVADSLVTTEGVVAKRTPTYCSVRLKGNLPGSSIELPFSRIHQSQSDAPPADGPPYNLGDRVTLIHPKGEPDRALLKESNGIVHGEWIVWSGCLFLPLSIGIWWLDARRDRKRFHLQTNTWKSQPRSAVS